MTWLNVPSGVISSVIGQNSLFGSNVIGFVLLLKLGNLLLMTVLMQC